MKRLIDLDEALRGLDGMLPAEAKSEYQQGLASGLALAKVRIVSMPSTQQEIVRCRECRHRFVDGENVRFNVCELNHNKVQADDWFCADGERRSENERSD